MTHVFTLSTSSLDNKDADAMNTEFLGIPAGPVQFVSVLPVCCWCWCCVCKQLVSIGLLDDEMHASSWLMNPAWSCSRITHPASLKNQSLSVVKNCCNMGHCMKLPKSFTFCAGHSACQDQPQWEHLFVTFFHVFSQSK